MVVPSNIQADAEAKAAREVRELLIEMQSVAYSYATTYTTVVIFGAYAALFTVWSQTKDAMSERTTASIGILISISVITFVAFEIFKMLVTSREFMRIRALLVTELPPAVFLEKRAALARAQNLFVQRVIMPVWIAVLLVTVVTGFGAAFLLLSSFFSMLWTAPQLALPSS